jgi:hypothetical protein
MLCFTVTIVNVVNVAYIVYVELSYTVAIAIVVVIVVVVVVVVVVVIVIVVVNELTVVSSVQSPSAHLRWTAIVWDESRFSGRDARLEIRDSVVRDDDGRKEFC